MGFNYERDLAQEKALYAQLGIVGPYICVHEEGSDVQMQLDLPAELAQDHQLVRVRSLTDNFLDWRLTLERASKLVLIDSSFSNLVEGLNLTNEKYLVVRSPRQFTPVYRNGWPFVFVNKRVVPDVE